MLHVTCHMWHMTCDMSHVTHDIHVKFDKWHVTCDMWHVKDGGRWKFSLNFRSLAHMVCRTAPATLGLLFFQYFEAIQELKVANIIFFSFQVSTALAHWSKVVHKFVETKHRKASWRILFWTKRAGFTQKWSKWKVKKENKVFFLWPINNPILDIIATGRLSFEIPSKRLFCPWLPACVN